MTTEDDVQRAYDQNTGRGAWSKFADFKTMITQIINLYEKTYPWRFQRAQDELDYVEELIDMLVSYKPATGGEVKEHVAIIMGNMVGDQTRPPGFDGIPAVARLPAPQQVPQQAPPPAAPPFVPNFGLAQAPSLGRSRESLSRGRRLARAADVFIDAFHWIARAEEGFLPLFLAPTGPTDRQGVNQFWQFVQGPRITINRQASMNCWESVFYCAHKAGLISKGTLRGIFDQAVHAASLALGDGPRAQIVKSPGRTGSVPDEIKDDVKRATRAYVNTLIKILQGWSKEYKELPRIYPDQNQLNLPKGDVIFIGGAAHVCISAGRHIVNGKSELLVYSLWEQNGGRFARLPLKDIVDEKNLSSLSEITAVPCPF
jgi:hypothetical protein